MKNKLKVLITLIPMIGLTIGMIIDLEKTLLGVLLMLIVGIIGGFVYFLLDVLDEIFGE
jgi:hypothetical protein